MDPQNQNNQVTPIQPIPTTAPLPVQPPSNLGWNEKFKNAIKGANLDKYKFVFIGVGAFFVLLIVLGVTFSLMNRREVATKSTPTPKGTSFQEVNMEEIKNPSRYATDSVVLQIQSDVETLDKDLNSVDLKENFLRAPDIKFDESFE